MIFLTLIAYDIIITHITINSSVILIITIIMPLIIIIIVNISAFCSDWLQQEGHVPRPPEANIQPHEVRQLRQIPQVRALQCKTSHKISPSSQDQSVGVSQ